MFFYDYGNFQNELQNKKLSSKDIPIITRKYHTYCPNVSKVKDWPKTLCCDDSLSSEEWNQRYKKACKCEKYRRYAKLYYDQQLFKLKTQIDTIRILLNDNEQLQNDIRELNLKYNKAIQEKISYERNYNIFIRELNRLKKRKHHHRLEESSSSVMNKKELRKQKKRKRKTSSSSNNKLSSAQFKLKLKSFVDKHKKSSNMIRTIEEQILKKRMQLNRNSTKLNSMNDLDHLLLQYERLKQEEAGHQHVIDIATRCCNSCKKNNKKLLFSSF